MKRIRDPQDFWSGVLFILIAVAAIVLGRRYPFGSLEEMGPGFFPTVIGTLLALMGVAACARSLLPGKAQAALASVPLRPVVFVLGAVMAFGFSLTKLGVIVASVVLVVVSRLAAPGFKWVEVLVFASVLTVSCALVFVWGLKMPMAIWPAFLGG